MSILSNLKKTRDSLTSLLSSASNTIDADTLDRIEEAFVQSDCGLETTDKIRAELHKKKGEWRPLLQQVLREILSPTTALDSVDLLKNLATHQSQHNTPYVILMIGVNGAGKTTTIGKLCYLLKQHQKRTLLASADTFRAAASEQLNAWATQYQADIAKSESKDPSAVLYTAIEQGIAQNYDVIIADTAGRQFNQQGLMQELEKMHRTMKKISPELPHQTWIVVDASSGQNAVHQAHAFQQVVPITGCIVSKLDGTAKGGMILSLVDQLKIPICYLGIGEKADQLLGFDIEEFIQGLVPQQLQH